MSLKPKAARRLLLVGVLGVIAVAMLLGLIVVRSWQNERRTKGLRADGMAAYQKADYLATIDALSGFLKRQPKDREAWLAFADAREHVEESGGRHLPAAMFAYERAFAMDDTDAATGLKLLHLYNSVGRFVEAKDLAARLRPADLASAGPAHVPVLMEEAAARAGLKAYDEQLNAITERIVALDPDGYRPAIQRSAFLLNANRKDDAVAFVTSRQQSHPNDVRFEFLKQATLIQAGKTTDTTEYFQVLGRASGLDPLTAKRLAEPTYTETEFAGQLASSFDLLGRHMDSLRVLQDAAGRLHDADSRRILARREWQAGLATQFLTDFPQADTGPKGEHSEILAFRALAMRDLGRKDEVAALLTALRARTRDYLATSWSSALSALTEKTDPKEALGLIDAAIKAHPAEPVFAYFRGDALFRLGRAQEAREAWEAVYKSNLSVGWAAPGTRIAETLLDEGRLEEGAKAAGAILQRARFSPAANLVVLRAEILFIEAGRPVPDAAATLAKIDEATDRLKQFDNPDLQLQVRRLLLPARVVLLTTLGRKTEGVALVEQAIADQGVMNGDLARRLAIVSNRLGLGLESRVVAASADASGDTGTLLSRALVLEASGKREAALALVDTALAQATDANRTEIAVSRAQFYDAVGHADALKAWRSVIEANPRSLPVHLSAIRARASCTDPAFVDQLAARITELGGSDPDHPTADIRFARARAMLAKSPTARQRDDAVAILRQLVVEAPGRIDARNVLIDALLMEDREAGIQRNDAAAIEQLNAVAALVPDRAPYTLRVSSVLLQQGRTADAAAQLSNLALDTAAGAEGRLAAVDRLTSLREMDAALRGIESIIGDPPSTNPRLLIRRASLLVSLRRDRDAAEAYRRILEQPLTDPDIIATVAAALRSLNDAAGATAAMAKLDDPSIKPADRALAKAAVAAGAGDTATALSEYSAATTAAPDEPRTWLALARFHLGRSELVPAEAAAHHGLEHAPANTELQVVLQQVLLAGKNADTADLTPLISALAANPATARRADALRAIAAARTGGSAADAAALGKLADEFIDDPSTQLFATRRLMAFAPPRIDEAARIIRRAAARYPSDPSVQELAARTLSQAEQWDAALEASAAWRTLTRRPEADLAFAESHLALGHARIALDAVRGIPLPPSIADTDTASLGILNVRVRAGAMLGDTAAAFRLLQPYLAGSSIVRTRIALPTAVSLLSDPVEARTWIDAAAATMDPQSMDEQMALASTLGMASDRFPKARTELLNKAIAITDLFASKPDATARVFEIRAALLDSLGDKPGAIAACRAALTKDPRSVTVLGRLVALLFMQRADPAEIIPLARQAVEASGGAPGPLMLLTNALFDHANRISATDKPAGDAARTEAAENLKKLVAAPVTNSELLIQIATLAERMNDLPAAISVYEKIIASANPPKPRELAIVKNNFAFALFSQNGADSSKDALRRAKTMIDEAIAQANDLAPLYETLGSIDVALADRAGALTAYRKAISIDAHSLDALVGLAGLLASGSAPERAEAATLIRTIETEDPSAGKLSESRKQQLRDAKQKLSGG